mgnify:FL=1
MRGCAGTELLLAGLLLAGCGGSPVQSIPALQCDGVANTVLAVGAHLVLDLTGSNGCLRLPAAPAGGTEHLVVAVSANGTETLNGVAAGFTLMARPDTFAPPALRLPARTAGPEIEDPAADFHAMLRARDRERAPEVRRALAGLRAARLTVPPQVGDQRSFQVCRTDACTGFVAVSATARYVGTRSAIFLDDVVPTGGYTTQDLDAIGLLFDQQLHPIDTLAFGSESDIDGNGVVVVLLSDQVNALSPQCAKTHSIIVGYFYGSADLDPSNPNSNHGEVFYGIVPDPSKPTCFSKSFVQAHLGPVFIHEFQHMISYNHHVLQGGGAAEETWLNEGLSHFAEELGGRLVTPGSCMAGNCMAQFAWGNVGNAYDYLSDPAAHFLVEAGKSTGTLAERGANWLFVRWLLDRSPTDPILGTDLTRRFEGADQPGGTVLTGSANVVAVAQIFDANPSFAQLLGEWHLANWATALPGFSEPSARLLYTSWNLPLAFTQIGLVPYPLRPDSTDGADYTLQGTLRGGSGSYLRLVQSSLTPAVAVGLYTGNPAVLMPRVAVVRLR